MSVVVNTYNSAVTNATETAPSGATSVVIEVWGAGGGAGCRTNGSGGGGGGGYEKCASITVSPGDTIKYSIGAGGLGAVGTPPLNGANSSAATTLNTGTGGFNTTVATNLIGNFGSHDGAAGIGGAGGAAGTGGTVNTGGSIGVAGGGGVSGNGGAAGNAAGTGGLAEGGAGVIPGGGGGGNVTSPGGNGANGQVVFTYQVTATVPKSRTIKLQSVKRASVY